MIIKPFILGAIATAALAAGLSAQPARPAATREFMRQKLEHSQRVLEGIATEDFELIAKQARKLAALSQEAGWRAFDNPDYLRHSDIFRRNASAVAKAAADRNLDGVTLAYVKMTMNCVECHKFIRGKDNARLNDPGESPFAARR